MMKRILGTVGTIIIPSWVVPGGEPGWGPLDLTNGVGVAEDGGSSRPAVRVAAFDLTEPRWESRP